MNHYAESGMRSAPETPGVPADTPHNPKLRIISLMRSSA
jgi:hypothetical protein